LTGAHLSLLRQCQNMKGNDSTVQGKTKHTDKPCNLKNKKDKLKAQLKAQQYELFLLTVPIEEVAHWQYKTVLIIFHLNLPAITIALDVVKWRGGGYGVGATVHH